jgi:hypothetical protein
LLTELLMHQYLGTLERYGNLPYCLPIDFKDSYDIDAVLSHEDPTILLLKGAAVDHISCSTVPLRSRYWKGGTKSGVNEIEHLQNWSPECEKYFVLSNAKPYLKLDDIISNWLRRRGENPSAFRTLKSLIERFTQCSDLDGYSFITTKNGRYGFVLGAARVGDLVFVAYGSGYPLVLRQEDVKVASYRWVGCAIITELMDGEAIEMVKVGKLDEQTIILR